MANMSYCRFQNTCADLADCLEHIDDEDVSISIKEKVAREELINICVEILERLGYEVISPEGDTHE